MRSDGVRRGQGRPSRVYSLTPEGDKVFPRTYEQVATALLEDVRALDGDAKVTALFEHRRKRLLEDYRTRLAGKNLGDRVTALAEIRNEEGFLADAERRDKDTFVLTEHNCPIRTVAGAYSQVCACEIALFADALGAEVTRTEHILAGSPRCRYVITQAREPRKK